MLALLLTLAALAPTPTAWAKLCATPGNDGSTFSASPNTYYPGVTATGGTASITVGTARTGAGASATPIAVKDLLLIIQMQGADITTTSSNAYGAVSGNYTAGQYEYVVVSAVSGTTITTTTNLVNTYTTSTTTTSGTSVLRTFQVVRVPQYSTLTLGSSISPPAWNGSTGGIIALDVAGNLDFNGNTINASGLGFRGGAGLKVSYSASTTPNTQNGGDIRYLTVANATPSLTLNGMKGEGTAGTPRYVNVLGSTAHADLTLDGYPGGSAARGAPTNAGGGGNDNGNNSGGAGGANGGGGGHGGYSSVNPTTVVDIGGVQGAAFGVASSGRLVLGGGGGAGTNNDGSSSTATSSTSGFASSGAPGGGMVLVRTGTVSGAGGIAANGAAAAAVRNDGGGGGGAGGSILLTATASQAGLSGLTMSATGGAGGNTRPVDGTAGSTAHGPGGGGGGGVVLTTAATATTLAVSTAGGTNGTSTPGTTTGTGAGPFGATAGGVGSGSSSTATSNTIANSTAGSSCIADLRSTITASSFVNTGQSVSAQVTFRNAGPLAGTATGTVTLPMGATVTAAPGGTIVVNAGVTTITYSSVSLAATGAASNASYTITYTATAAGTLTVSSTVAATGTTTEGGLTANNPGSASTTVSNVGAVGTPAPCATPGKDGAATALAGTVNTYFAGTASVAAKTSATSIPVAASVGASTGITPGDLLLVIQMQGADINSSNNNAYGANNASGGGNLSNANFIAGTYEYVVATSSLAANTAGTITVAALVNSYATAAATTTTPRQSYQVVRIPQYSSITLGGQLDALAWNGSSGGILAIDVAGTLNLNGKILNAAAAGFRGGAGLKYTGSLGAINIDYRTSSGLAVNATKGEGTAGTPRYTLLSLTAAATDNSTNTAAFASGVVNGYPNGDNGKGAPGNAGGGGTDDNSLNNGSNTGGGGGANGGAGGLGGWPRINGTINMTNQAVGGVAFAPVSSSRLVMGGGGGAGTSNDGNGDATRTGIYSSGAPGGGLILVRTGTVSGTGTANASGDGGYLIVGANSSNDGGGGGGAGGTVLITASTPDGLTGLTVLATGGSGTSNSNTADVAHGPGGGGGGGVVLANGTLNAASSVAAGTAGTTASNDSYNGTTYGAAPGTTGVVNTQISPSIAGSAAGTACVADVATTITGPATASAGQPTGNYTATFSNTNTSGAANVTQTVTLPTGAGLTAAQQATIVAAYSGTTFTTTGSGTGINTTINFGTTTLLSGASNSFVFAYTAPTTASTFNTTSNTSTTTTEAGQTANNTASTSTTVSVAADVTVSLTGPTTLNAGQPTGTYTATFTNEGPGTATDVARLVTLPTGASLTTSQQATIVAAYPNATFSTTGSGTLAVTIINFGPVASLAGDAFSTTVFAFTAPTTTATNLVLTGNTSTTAAEGSNLAPNQSTLTLTTVETADVVATIVGSTSLVGTVPTGTFNVTFANNGPQTAIGVTRTVQLPTGLTGVVVSGADAGTYNATTGLVTYSTTPTTLTSGAPLTSTITFPIPTTRGQVVATAGVSTTTNEAGLMGNNSATAVLPAAYDLTTTISGPTTAAIAGSPVTLYVTTTNNGPSTAPTALQTVSIPSSVPLTDVYITNGGTYSYNNTTKIGTVTFPDPANPASGVTVTNLPSGQTIANSISFTAPAENFAPTATVALNSTSTGTGDLDTNNNTANLNNGVAGTPVVVNTNTATLATANESTTITTTSTIVSAGTVVTYKVSATNHGPGIATNVVEQVQLLPGLTTGTLALSGTTSALAGTTITYSVGTTTVATYSTTTGILTYATLPTQASGTPATQSFADIMLTVPATTGNNGQLLVTADVRTGTNDPAPADNVAAIAVKVTSAADLATTITGPTSTAAGQTASYTVAFTNNGSSTASAVAETMQLPAGLRNVIVQDPAGNVLAGAYSATTGLVTFPTVASDATGATQVYNVIFTAPGQTYSVSSSIGSGTTDNVGTNNASVLRTTVTPAADVAVSVSGPATATTGNAVTYAVTTLNNGPDAASGVMPSIQLATNLTGVTVISGAYDASSGKVTFNAYSLAVGESRVSLVSFTMPTSPTNGFVTGMAAVTTSSTDLVATNNTAGITTGAAPATPDMADLVTSITPSVTTVTAGSPLSYTIKFRNNTAGTPAINAVPTAYLPAGLTGVVVKDASGVVLPNAYNSVTGQITFPTIPSLTTANGPDYTVDLPAPSNANNVLISASAVSANTSDPNPANNSIGNTVNITAAFDAVTRLTGPATALPGSTNTYTVTTTNNGPSTAPASAATAQTVTLPAGVTATNITGSGTQAGNVITFPALSTTQAAGANGAITNTFSIVMPATGSLALSAAVTSTGESLTTNNGATLTTAPTNQVPVADNVWNTLQGARGNTANSMAATGLPISPLSATDPENNLNGYFITSLPDISQGVLYFNGVAVTSTTQKVTAGGLSFAPSPTFVGNATFTYVAVDAANGVSNTALYTVPVAKDLSAVYTTYNSAKGGSNLYVTGDILAQVVDASTGTYNSAGLIYDATTGVLQGGGAANGLPTTGTNATITSGTLPSGVSLDPATGRIYVSKASDLVNNTGAQTYTVTITTVDSNGGVTTQLVSFTIGAYPLPVVLTEFTATAVQNRDALLKWATASEANNDHFDVERSLDGTSFTQIAKVAGHGTTTVASAYTLTDANVAAKATGPVYYRLRQVDLDGSATYSPVRSVRFTTVTAPVALSLYPNPAQASTTLELSELPATGTYQVTLLDATGRTVRTATLGGGLPQPLDISDLATGTYHVLVTGQLADGSAMRQVLRLIKE